MIDIDNLQFDLIKRILSETIPEYSVWAFGSRVNGRPQKFSDLDLALVSNGKIDWRIVERLKDAFSESDLPIMIDVVDFNSVSENFRKLILENHFLIQ
ncbi:nucleotidyltransferase family protein [Desulforegula conservatrix]|uniref:nucleotidyltransferase family protein n=1 Tax=Desulforegula conservatrix TaxID=153026 RepID=UPI0004133149|nr:nucleotidyltransferase domain-containing protein [Desulforegula conservatrix]